MDAKEYLKKTILYKLIGTDSIFEAKVKKISSNGEFILLKPTHSFSEHWFDLAKIVIVDVL